MLERLSFTWKMQITCSKVVTTVMRARMTVTTSWMRTNGLMKTLFSGKIISTSAIGTSEKDLTTMLRCAMPCIKEHMRLQARTNFVVLARNF